MTKQEILDMLNKNQVVYLATAEGATPHVRGMMMYRAEDQGVVFHTGSNKDLAKQLRANPKAELCCFDPKTGVQVRLAGSVKFLFDMDLKKEIVSYFGDWVLEHYRVPVRNKIIGLAKVLLRHPVNLTLALTLQVYMRLRRNKFAEKYRGVSWTVIQSSKK